MKIALLCFIMHYRIFPVNTQPSVSTSIPYFSKDTKGIDFYTKDVSTTRTNQSTVMDSLGVDFPSLLSISSHGKRVKSLTAWGHVVNNLGQSVDCMKNSVPSPQSFNKSNSCIRNPSAVWKTTPEAAVAWLHISRHPALNSLCWPVSLCV